jgi:alpha-glucosidase (family GH31 glycosyl hydrolase)
VQGAAWLTLGGVDNEYELYVNGQKAAHHGSRENDLHGKTTTTDIWSYLKPGGGNVVCVRVCNFSGLGGISSVPVLISNQKVERESIAFNFGDKKFASACMGMLNNMGLDFWWIDGEAAGMEGLNAQMWTNRVYYDYAEKNTGKRAFVFSRYGGPGSHRYPAYFTGDCYSTWEVLKYQVPYTAKSGNVLMPFVTHDTGGFIGRLDDNFELYARWVEFCALSPILRLHSIHENPIEGNVRLPWNYGQKGIELCRKYFQLRYSLMPYMYTYCRIANETGLPLVRPMYLEHPEMKEAYEYEHQYYFGRELLVAPVVNKGDADGQAVVKVYLPAGKWLDYFNGGEYEGGRVIEYKCPLNDVPLFVKAGAIIPMQEKMAYSSEKKVDPLIVNVYAGDGGKFDLYEDDGESLDYRDGEYAWTPMSFENNGKCQIKIGPAKGKFKGQLRKRGYIIKLHDTAKPKSVKADGSEIAEGGSEKEQGWTWDEKARTVIIKLNARPVSKAVNINIEK